MKNLAFIAYWDERWLYYQFSLHHLGRMYFMNSLCFLTKFPAWWLLLTAWRLAPGRRGGTSAEHHLHHVRQDARAECHGQHHLLLWRGEFCDVQAFFFTSDFEFQLDHTRHHRRRRHHHHHHHHHCHRRRRHDHHHFFIIIVVIIIIVVVVIIIIILVVIVIMVIINAVVVIITTIVVTIGVLITFLCLDLFFCSPPAHAKHLFPDPCGSAPDAGPHFHRQEIREGLDNHWLFEWYVRTRHPFTWSFKRPMKDPAKTGSARDENRSLS